jgi:AraC-like DNA-binding protein
VRGPAELVIFTDRECHLLFALLPAIDLVAGIQVLQLSAEQLHAFAQNIETALSDANAAATSLATLPGMCASWLMRDRAPTRTQSMVTARRSAAVRAREYIDRNLDRSLTLASVCRASYSSPRALEYGFREVFGVSPIAYVRLSRLSCVRRELYEAAPIHGIVTQLAMKWGFWHLSQFAKDYQELFGELPSATLNRASSRLPAVRPRAQIR